MPLGGDAESVTLAFSEPPGQMEQGNLRLLLNKRCKIVLATPSAIHAVIKKQFGLGAETIQRLREEGGAEELDREIVFDVQGVPMKTRLASVRNLMQVVHDHGRFA